ncbi:AraC family transcriptional regulator [Parabacteroides sp. Marseille-P3160]|uniref:AraC family transcriptional regulator n=1 Tax=Parabacteroides sp. Marseille-P3160 TaxID=1917887 RepID=UPI0009BBA38C|nr:AraC family transcriptional regulator [Parabacteroides sp. Marseille-P3160]
MSQTIFNRSKHNAIKYLPTNGDENIWKMSISGVGFQSIDKKDSYPLKGHPIGYTFNPDRGRIIDEFALVYIIEGEGIFFSTSCPEKKIAKGDAFFLFPRQWHTYKPYSNTGWDEYWTTFKGDYFETLLNNIVNKTNPIFHIGINEQIVNNFTEMIECARGQKAGFQSVLAGIIMHTIGLIYSINKNQDYASVHMQKIQEACVLMRENIYDKFTPEDVARSINMSYSSFRKLFKEYTGIAPHQYMLQLKLSKIKDLLSSTELSIQDIAIKLNFESADYFSYFFKSKTGINPLSYRKNIEKQRTKNTKKAKIHNQLKSLNRANF